MDLIDSFLAEIENCTRLDEVDQVDQIVRIFDIDIVSNRYIVNINNLEILNEAKLKKKIEDKHFYNDEWLAFNEVVFSFIRLANLMNSWSLLESFDLYTDFLGDLAIAFNNANRGFLMAKLVRRTIGIVVPISTKLDRHMYFKEGCSKPRLTHLASVMLRIFNNIRSQMSGDVNDNSLRVSMKSSIIVYVGVRLCSTYFELSNPLLCRNVFSNMNNAKLKFSRYSLNEQLQYRYYLARFYLIKNQLIGAYQHFSWCLCNAPAVRNHRNITIILKFLIPISILLGKRPNFAFLSQHFYTAPHELPPYFAAYKMIYHAVRQGNYRAFCQILSDNRTYQFLKSAGLLLVFESKAPIIILRNLLKTVWLLSDSSSRLNYDSIAAALNISLPDQSTAAILSNSHQDTFIENILINMIDQNLLKGKIFPRLRSVSLAKSNVFPPVDHINFIRFGYGDEHTLNPIDSWLQT
ncbi:Piso0_005387 [Millerozyma farinosa CBS 7064]|uniref:Piso0_005387 protein n=1 Tax=Pichia sorbitophila (strain ATCC MYA-4447 / BCRC 22081 / CBS 7064 / NBRC 10061 / NRRL Y-12695) TaxID=559304 RepID=G8Y4Z1_PICSO|nr:Piso0_005387 [Millerozyma farinosa CBS 7064]